MAKGVIFDIEEFALYDGPGIRKTVFFKGCPLRCIWCHNPEGMNFNKELMVSKSSCINCKRCTSVCNHKVCVACGMCVAVCPLRLRKVCGAVWEAKDLAADLLKDSDFLEKNHGGITISGGEPLAQPEFLWELLERLKPIHTAVETSGYAPPEAFVRTVELADLVLFDIKHTDSIVHKEFTGVGNELILENLKYLCRAEKRFIARIPLIPGVNDTRDNMEKTAQLLKDAKGLYRVEILPYHKTAGAKYPMLGREYNPGFDENRKPDIHKDVFDNLNIRSLVL